MSVKSEKAKMLRYKKAILAELNIATITQTVLEISGECEEIKWFASDDELLDALDGDEEQAFEFKFVFSDLCYECDKIIEVLTNTYITEHFDDFFVGIMLKDHSAFNIIGYDSAEEDYFRITSFEENLATTESGKRLKRLTKDEMISVCGQCFAIAISFFNVRYKYDYIKATFDIIQNGNNAILQIVKDIENYYLKAAEDDFYEYGDAVRNFDRLTNQLPDRIWIE